MFHLTNHDVWVLTARDGDRIGGQVATWIVPVTLVPGVFRAAVVLSPLNHTWGLIHATGRFVMHLLAEDQVDWLPRFGLQSGRDVDKFAGIATTATRGGLPVLPGTCGWAEVRIVDHMDGGDRIVALCEAVEIGPEPPRPPLRLKDAFGRLPPDVVQALSDRRDRDGQRDRAWLKDFGAPAAPRRMP